MSTLFTPTSLLIQFPQNCGSSCCFYVGDTVSKPYIYAGITHEASTLPLALPGSSLSPITLRLSSKHLPLLSSFGLRISIPTYRSTQVDKTVSLLKPGQLIRFKIVTKHKLQHESGSHAWWEHITK